MDLGPRLQPIGGQASDGEDEALIADLFFEC
jgi:hypothetical protein